MVNLQPDARAGWHVHSGVTCGVHKRVGGHYYQAGLPDPFADTLYEADSAGAAAVHAAGPTHSARSPRRAPLPSVP